MSSDQNVDEGRRRFGEVCDGAVRSLKVLGSLLQEPIASDTGSTASISACARMSVLRRVRADIEIVIYSSHVRLVNQGKDLLRRIGNAVLLLGVAIGMQSLCLLSYRFCNVPDLSQASFVMALVVLYGILSLVAITMLYRATRRAEKHFDPEKRFDRLPFDTELARNEYLEILRIARILFPALGERDALEQLLLPGKHWANQGRPEKALVDIAFHQLHADATGNLEMARHYRQQYRETLQLFDKYGLASGADSHYYGQAKARLRAALENSFTNALGQEPDPADV